jgi:hypothetical protein
MGNLIHLAQIKDGLALKQNLEQLQTSYDAYKVLTDIAKDGGGNYNVNELLASLKQTVDTQLGGSGEGTVEGRIAAAQAELEDLLNSRVDSVLALPIKDKVRVTASYDPVSKGFTFTNLGEAEDGTPLTIDQFLVANNVDTTVPYMVYFDDNKPVRDADGKNVTVNLDTMTLSDDPHERGTAAGSDGNLETVFNPIAGEVNVKFFPVGSFTLGTLSEDYLLDNEEYNLIAYSEVIDEIVLGLASNDQLTQEIAALVGEQAVQDQIKAITDALATRITEVETDLSAIESTVDTLTGDENTEGSIAKQIKDAVGDLESGSSADLKTLEDAIRANYVERVNKDIDLQKEIDFLKSVKHNNEAFTPTAGQTVFTLTKEGMVAPEVLPDGQEFKVYVFINGVRYRETKAFTVDREAKTVTWTFTDANGGFDIEADFSVEIAYVTATEVVVPPHIEAAPPILPVGGEPQ